MTNEDRGLVGVGLSRFTTAIVYLFICLQYVVLFLAMQQTSQKHSLSFENLLLPVLYVCPLGIALGFKRHIRNLLRADLLSIRVANICNDWMTLVLAVVYGILLDFRTLH